MIRSDWTRLSSVSSVALAALLVAHPAFAQTAANTGTSSANAVSSSASEALAAAAAPQDGLVDIVVTANKRSQNIQKVGGTVLALTGAELTAAGVNDVSRLEQLSPGLVYAKGGNDAKIALRGVNSNSTFADNTSVVGFFVDGVYKPRASQQTRAFFDVSQVEVLRGPQGTLYGRNTLGGAVNVNTNGPDLSKQGLSFGFIGQYSTFNDVRTEGFVNAGVTDTFGLRLAVLTDNSDGWVKNLVGRNLGIADTLSFRASTRFAPSRDAEFTLRVTRIQDNGNPAGMFAINGSCRTIDPNGLTDPYGAVLDCQNPRRGSGGTKPFDLIGDNTPGESNLDKRTVSRDFVNNDRLSEFNATLDGKYNFGPVMLKSITSYTNYESLLGNDADYSSNNNGREWVNENNKSYTQEFQLLSQWKGPLQVTAGAYISRDELFFSYSSLRTTVDNLAARPTAVSTNGITLPVQSGTPLVSSAIQINSTSNNTQFITSDYFGLFGEATYSLISKWRIIGGVRYNDERKHATNGNAAFVGSLTPSSAPSDPRSIFPYNDATATAKSNVTATFKNVTWRAGTEYDVARDVMAYFTASTGFLSGVMNQNGTVTQPQKSRSFELGAKSRFWDRRAELNVAVYDVDYTALATTFQIPVPNNPGSFTTLSSNGGEIKAQGVEIALALLPVDQWHVSLGFSYNHSKYGKFGMNLPGGFQVINGAVPASRFIDLSGQRPPYTPVISISAASSYDFKVGFGYITPGLNFRYSDSYYAAGGLPFDRAAFQSRFTQTDLRIAVSDLDRRFTLEAFVQNLEDVIINERTQTGGDGLEQANYSLPRTAGIRFKANF